MLEQPGPDQTIVRQVILDELPKDAQINHSGAVRTAVQMIKPPSRSAGQRAVIPASFASLASGYGQRDRPNLYFYAAPPSG
jgi:hypothetical protein